MARLQTLRQLSSADALRSVAVGLALACAVVMLSGLGVFRALEYELYDVRIRQANLFSPPASDDIVHVAVDDGAVERLGRWPWRRSVIAEAIRALDGFGARTIVFDIIYEQEAFAEWWPEHTGRPPRVGDVAEGVFEARSDDDALASAIADAGNVIIGVRTRELRDTERAAKREVWRQWGGAAAADVPEALRLLQIEPALQHERVDPIPAVREPAAGVGLVTFDETRTGENIHEFQAEVSFYDGQRVAALGLIGAARYLGLGVEDLRRTDDHYKIGDLASIPLTRDGFMLVPWLPRRGEAVTVDDRARGEAPRWKQAHRVVSIADVIELWADVQTERRLAVAVAAALIGDGALVGQIEAAPVGPLPAAIGERIDAALEPYTAGVTRDELQAARDELRRHIASGEGDEFAAEELRNVDLILAWWAGREAAAARTRIWGKLAPAIEDKLVFVGLIQTAGLHDVAPSPLGEQTPGVTAHAAMAQGVLTAADPAAPAHLLRPTPVWLNLVVTAALGLLSAVLATSIAPKRSWIALLGLGVVTAALNVIAFDAMNTVFELAAPMVGLGVAYVGSTTYRAIQFRRERAAIRAQFAARVSPQLVDILVDNPGLMNMAGESREITTVFTDFAGFTAVSESLSDQEIVGIINLYLRELAEVMMQEGAYINKFLGDGIMAFWGAPHAGEDDITAALRTGVSLFDVMDRVNDEQEAKGFKRLGMRVGMSTGEVIVGDCGAPPRLNDYTVIGDAVNLAARLESAAKQFGADFLITQDTIERADAALVERIHWRPIGKIRVVGQTQGKDIAEVIGWKHADDRDAEIEEWIAKTAEAVRLYQAGDYAASQVIWQDLVLYPRGAAGAIMYAERCAELIESGATEQMLPLRSK